MISYKSLTILNMIIILSYCSAHKNLTEQKKLFNENCIEFFTCVGLVYKQGFLNACFVLHFHSKINKEIEAPEMKFREYVNNNLNNNKNYEMQTEKDREEIVNELTQFYNEVTDIQIRDKFRKVKTPKEFCTGSVIKDYSFSNRISKSKCTDDILKNYDSTDKFGNVLKSFDDVMNIIDMESDDEIEKEITSWSDSHVRYLIYHLNMIYDDESETKQYTAKNWCKKYIKTKFNPVKSPEDVKLANEVVENTDKEEKEDKSIAIMTLRNLLYTQLMNK